MVRAELDGPDQSVMTNPPTEHPFATSGLQERFDVVDSYVGGEGWSGAVRERATGEVRFLKLLEAGVDVNEGSLLASLVHARIPRVLETGKTQEGRAYLVREHLDGAPLTADLPLGPAATIEVATQLLEVLAYVHLRGILHLDVKPANVLRCGTPEAPSYALLDFGLGRRGHGPAAGGTLFYAAPERLLGLEPDARSDLFSLGALLYASLHPPSAATLRRFHQRFPRDGFFDAVGADRDDLPEPFGEFLPRLLARAPGERFPDAQEALEALVGGSGRPSLALLRPDVIRLFGHRVAATASQGSLVIAGGDAEDRHALALHAGCVLDGVESVEDRDDDCLVVRDGDAESVFEIDALGAGDLTSHLETAVGLEAEAARAAARALLAGGATSAAMVARTLTELVERGRIVPDGPRWVWPDADAGRLDLASPEVLEATPDALRSAASRGHVEAALRSYRRGVRSMSSADDRLARAALAEGLLLGGEPGRALPVVHDLPAQRTRALLDLGRVREAERCLQEVDDAHVTPHTVAHLRACVDFLRGDLESAERTTAELVDAARAAEHRVLRVLVLARLGRTQDAIALSKELLLELAPESQPFLRSAALTNLAVAERAIGELEHAQEHHAEALRLSRTLGHVRQTATSSNNLGIIAKDRQRWAEAREHLRRARALYLHVDDRAGAALAEANLGIVCLEEGDPRSAVRRLENSLEELDRLGSLQQRPLVLVLLARAHAALGDAERAVTCIEQAGPLTGRLMDEAEKARRSLEQPAPARGHRDRSTQRDLRSSSASDAVFQTFLAVNRKLAGDADLERAMHFLLDAAVTLTGGRGGYLLVARPDGVRMEVRTGDGSGAGTSFSRSMVNRALQRRRVLTEADVLDDAELQEMSSVRDLRQRSAICVPFTSASGLDGALYVEHPGRADVFGPTEKERLDVLADQAAIAVDRMLQEEVVAAELEQSRRDLQAARRELARSQPARMLGKSAPMKQLRATIEKLAPSDLSVLVLGETGTGKELVARALHQQSNRARGNFVSENCSAIPLELMESELFGHRKGAFTGADEDRAGLLELASGGTLFLDEVGDMPLALQAKLLRVLQEQRARRVGGAETFAVDVRVIAATHKDLHRLVADGEFREDLYYRLAAAEVTVPPLRERGDDIRLLATEFIERLNRQHRRSARLTEDGVRRLSEYPWPGNVRELEHVISRAFILTDGDELSSFDLPDTMPASAEGEMPTSWPVMTLAESEARTIRAALERTGGDKTAAAKLLGISRTAIYEKLKRMKREGL